jgi:hypothetical protein
MTSSEDVDYNDWYEIEEEQFHELEEEKFLSQRHRVPCMMRSLKRHSNRGRNENEKKKNRDKRRNRLSMKSRDIELKRAVIQQGKTVENNCEIESNHSYSSHCPEVQYIGNRDNSYDYHDDIRNETRIYAGEIGIEDSRMQDRLMSILEGDEITPEDYELLLLLDNNNKVQTLDESEISKFPVVKLGEGSIDLPTTTSSKCDICLESWSDLPKSTELRCLPCDHVFCKVCIDDWLTQRSRKCPNLSCYWCMEEE